MNSLKKLQVLARHGPYEVGVLLVGLVYLEMDGKISTEDSPVEAVRKIPDIEAKRNMMKQLQGDK